MYNSTLSNGKVITERQSEIYTKNCEVLDFWRQNPCLAARDILGIELLDYQRYMLQNSWDRPSVLWCCSRNAGKTFLAAVLIILRAVLFNNQSIYIAAPSGKQSKELFTKIEEIVLNSGSTAASTDGLTGYVANEIKKTAQSVTGFSHDPSGHTVEFYNGSKITTLNSEEVNVRGRRANLVVFDEAAFIPDKFITTIEPFTTQNSDFILSTNDQYDSRAKKKRLPNQLLYCSSADSVDGVFYKYYRDFSIKMIMGNRDYFVVDIPCDIPLAPTRNGQPEFPLLKKEDVEKAMRNNKEKALREYYNKFQTDGGDSQILKRSTIKRNEKIVLPELENVDDAKYVLAFDPASAAHGSIVSVMKILHDDDIGYYGQIVNCVNMVEMSSKKNLKMISPDQAKELRQMIINYNGNAEDYKNIQGVYIDAGAGGGGVSAYADNLLDDFIDDKGVKHHGMADFTYGEYINYKHRYPNAKSIIKLIDPKGMKKKMIVDFIDLVNSDLIQFTEEYSDYGYVMVRNGEEYLKRNLSLDEEVALRNLDLMKTEITSIHRYKNATMTDETFEMSKEKRINYKLNDDRFYTAILLGNCLYELRRGEQVRKQKAKISFKDAIIAPTNSNKNNWLTPSFNTKGW